MRILLLVVALTAGGCAHAPTAAALSDSEAIRLARAEASRRGMSLKGLRPSVGRFDTGTSVFFNDPKCAAGCLDGLPRTFFIPAGKRRVAYADDGRV